MHDAAPPREITLAASPFILEVLAGTIGGHRHDRSAFGSFHHLDGEVVGRHVFFFFLGCRRRRRPAAARPAAVAAAHLCCEAMYKCAIARGSVQMPARMWRTDCDIGAAVDRLWPKSHRLPGESSKSISSNEAGNTQRSTCSRFRSLSWSAGCLADKSP